MKTPPIHFLTQEETKRLMSVIKKKRDKAIFLTAYSYGLRASEIGLLHIDDVDLEGKEIAITRLKGSISKSYPLRPEVSKLIRSYLRTRSDNSPLLFPSRFQEPLSRRSLDYMMKRYAKAANIPPKKRHFHVLKRSIGTHLYEATKDLLFVKDRLGHKDIKSTMVYVDLVNSDETSRKAFASAKVV